MLRSFLLVTVLLFANAVSAQTPPDDDGAPKTVGDGKSTGKQEPEKTLEDKQVILLQGLEKKFFGQPGAKQKLLELYRLEATGVNLTGKPSTLLFYGGEGIGKTRLISAYAEITNRKIMKIVPSDVNAGGERNLIDKIVNMLNSLKQGESFVLHFEDIELLNDNMTAFLTNFVAGKTSVKLPTGCLVTMTTQKGTVSLNQYIQSVVQNSTPVPVEQHPVMGFDTESKRALEKEYLEGKQKPILSQNPIGFKTADGLAGVNDLNEALSKQQQPKFNINVSRDFMTTTLEGEGVPHLLLSNIGTIYPFLPPSPQEAQYAAVKYISEALDAFRKKFKVEPVFKAKSVRSFVDAVLRPSYRIGMSHVEIRSLVVGVLEQNLVDAVAAGKIIPGERFYIIFSTSKKTIGTFCSRKLTKGEPSKDILPEADGPSKDD